MAVKIERGGWVLIFLVGVALVGYSLNRYGVVDFSKWTGGKSSSGSGETVDATKPLLLPACVSRTSSPMQIMGTPSDIIVTVRRFLTWRLRNFSTSGSSVGPSAPQFHL